MAKKAGEGPKQLSPGADAALAGCGEKILQELEERARRLASGEEVTDEHVERAYEELIDPKGLVKIQNVISTALRENSIFEKFIYFMIFLIIITGILFLCMTIYRSDDTAIKIAGTVGGYLSLSLLLPAARYAINVRQHNISIRLVGALIAKSADPKKLGPALERLLLRIINPRS